MSILDYIFPKQCLLCSRIGTDICDCCLKKLSHTLPTCFVCNKLSNNYLTHFDCLDIQIQCLTGWYPTKEIVEKLKVQGNNGIYGTYSSLMDSLIKYFGIQDIISKSNIYPIHSKDMRVNKSLSTTLSKRSSSNENTLLVGTHIEDMNLLKDQLSKFNTPNIRVLVLFLRNI